MKIVSNVAVVTVDWEKWAQLCIRKQTLFYVNGTICDFLGARATVLLVPKWSQHLRWSWEHAIMYTIWNALLANNAITGEHIQYSIQQLHSSSLYAVSFAIFHALHSGSYCEL